MTNSVSPAQSVSPTQSTGFKQPIRSKQQINSNQQTNSNQPVNSSQPVSPRQPPALLQPLNSPKRFLGAGSAVIVGSELGTGQRLTRRRSSAGPTPPVRPLRPREPVAPTQRGGLRPTFLTLRDHGKVYVADLPRLSDGQLAHVTTEAREVLESLGRRLEELEAQPFLSQAEQDTRIRASTKRDVTERFIRSVEDELQLRLSNPSLRAAAGESLARAFLELARNRLPTATFDSLFQEALASCGPEAAAAEAEKNHPDPAGSPQTPVLRSQPMPVVLSFELAPPPG